MSFHDTILTSQAQGVKDLLGLLKPKREAGQKAEAWAKPLLSDGQWERLHTCGDWVTMLSDREGESLALEQAFFCGLRLCPGCAWRKSVATAECVSTISAQLEQQGLQPIFITVTVPNCAAEKLRDTCLMISKAWGALLRRKGFKAWGDSFRKLEITYNSRADTYHPHLHTLAFVPKSYFKGGRYISRGRLLEAWREVTGIPEITQVDIRRCTDPQKRGSAVLEVSKYVAKSGDYMASPEVYATYWRSLAHLRTLAYSGKCRDLKRDYDAGRLTPPPDLSKYAYRLCFWYFQQEGGYVLTAKERYTPPVRTTLEEKLQGLTLWEGATPWDAAALAEEV